MSKFSVGDKVKLTQSGPIMVVTNASDPREISCGFFNASMEYKYFTFPEAALTLSVDTALFTENIDVYEYYQLLISDPYTNAHYGKGRQVLFQSELFLTLADAELARDEKMRAYNSFECVENGEPKLQKDIYGPVTMDICVVRLMKKVQ